MSETERRVEFIGLPSPYAYPDVAKALGAPIKSRAERQQRRELRAEVQKRERKRQREGFARFRGRTELHLDERHGLSRPYTWGPHNYVVSMPASDVEILMKMHPDHRQAFVVHPEIVIVRRSS